MSMNSAELTMELVKINSENPPGREKEVARFIHDYLSDIGIESEMMEFGKDRFNVVASAGRREGLMLNGHIDTVPVGNRFLWKSNPFGELKDRKIYGRGTSDMKGGVASILASLGKIDFKSAKRKLVLAFVGDEETGFGGSDYLIKNASHVLEDVKYGVIAEPTDMKIQTAQKGIVEFKVNFSGKAAHGSMPWLGENAIYKAVSFVDEVRKLGESMEVLDPVLGKGTLNVGVIAGGTKVNVVPDFCELEIERRLVTGEDPDSFIEQIRGILEHMGAGADLEVVSKKPAFSLDEGSEILFLMKQVSGSETFATTAYTEAEMYKSMADIDCVVFGPGNKESIHKPDEYVSVQNLEECSKVFENLIRKWCF